MRHLLAGPGPAPARVDLRRACELLHLDRHTAASTYLHALALGLAEALDAAPEVCRPGTPSLSFDEAWLIRLLERAQSRDAESVAFLISSRVAPPHRSSIAFLVDGLAARLPERPQVVSAP